MKKLDQLTFTRFIAAFMVIVFHGGVGIFPFNFYPVIPLLSSGTTAVSYFFVLSGFVMALAYYQPEKHFDLGGYFKARFSRIYPIYILSFIVTAFFYLDIMSRMKWDKILANIFLYQAWIPRFSQSFNMASWSLSVETFFYLVFPLLAILLPRLSTRWIIGLSLGFWTISQVVHFILYMQWMPEQNYLLSYFPPFHLNAFLLGVAGGIWYRTRPAGYVVDQKMNRRWLLLGLALSAAALSVRYFRPGLLGALSLDEGLLAPFFLIIILTLALDTTRLARSFSHPRLVLLGDASYALYILHVPVRWWIERTVAAIDGTIGYSTIYYFYVPFVLILSVAVFIWIERPARDWLRHNMDKLPVMVLDLALLAISIWLAFAIRLGAEQQSFAHAQLYSFRVAIPVYFLSLLLVGVYRTSKPPWIAVGLAILGGGIVFTGLMYLAWRSGWIEGFPRTVIMIDMAVAFILIYSSRLLLRLRKPRPILEGRQA